MMEIKLKVVALRDAAHYEIITLPKQVCPRGVSLEARSITVFTQMQVMFFNDGRVRLIYPN